MKKTSVTTVVSRVLTSKYLLIGFASCFLVFFLGISSVIQIPEMKIYQDCRWVSEGNEVVVHARIEETPDYLYAYEDRSQATYKLAVSAMRKVGSESILSLSTSVDDTGLKDGVLFTIEIPGKKVSLLQKVIGG